MGERFRKGDVVKLAKGPASGTARVVDVELGVVTLDRPLGNPARGLYWWHDHNLELVHRTPTDDDVAKAPTLTAYQLGKMLMDSDPSNQCPVIVRIIDAGYPNYAVAEELTAGNVKIVLRDHPTTVRVDIEGDIL